ncbi:MAG: phosphoenolpyruvate carboxykinase (ATP), partial [Limnochordales bacterium]
LRYTRAMVRAALAGDLDNVPMQREPYFGLMIPTGCPGVPGALLDPKALWADPDAYDRQARELAHRFAENYRRFGGAPRHPAEAAAGAHR